MHLHIPWLRLLVVSLVLGSSSGPRAADSRPAPDLRAAVASLRSAAGGLPSAADPVPHAASRQHVVAVVETPTSTTGLLYRFELTDGSWRAVGGAIPMVVGRSGVGPKREGDGRAPQGVFPLGFAFGYDERPPMATDVAYRHLPPESVCVDDRDSGSYNRIVFEPGEAADWESAEAMRRDLAHGDDLYSLGVTVGYNPEAVPGAGSCIFLHVWRGPESPTAGCTAMAAADLRTLVTWLRPGHQPVLIQGTRAYLEELRAEGSLPYAVPGS